MAGDRYTGEDVAITFDEGTGHMQGIDIMVERSEWEAPASDSDVEQGGMGRAKASATLKGWDTSAANGLSFADLAAKVITKEPPDEFSWTDKGNTPASRLPANFFTKFPISQWRVKSVSGGSGDANKPSEWTAQLVCGKID